MGDFSFELDNGKRVLIRYVQLDPEEGRNAVIVTVIPEGGPELPISWFKEELQLEIYQALVVHLLSWKE